MHIFALLPRLFSATRLKLTCSRHECTKFLSPFYLYPAWALSSCGFATGRTYVKLFLQQTPTSFERLLEDSSSFQERRHPRNRIDAAWRAWRSWTRLFYGFCLFFNRMVPTSPSQLQAHCSTSFSVHVSPMQPSHFCFPFNRQTSLRLKQLAPVDA